jgi:hypothetical protein
LAAYLSGASGTLANNAVFGNTHILPIGYFVFAMWALKKPELDQPSLLCISFEYSRVVVAASAILGIYRLWLGLIETFPETFYASSVDEMPEYRHVEPIFRQKWSREAERNFGTPGRSFDIHPFFDYNLKLDNEGLICHEAGHVPGLVARMGRMIGLNAGAKRGKRSFLVLRGMWSSSCVRIARRYLRAIVSGSSFRSTETKIFRSRYECWQRLSLPLLSDRN